MKPIVVGALIAGFVTSVTTTAAWAQLEAGEASDAPRAAALETSAPELEAREPLPEEALDPRPSTAEAPTPTVTPPRRSGPMVRPPVPDDVEADDDANETSSPPQRPDPPSYEGLLLAAGAVTWRMSSASPSAGDILGGLRVEGGYAMVGHALYGTLSASYLLGDLDGFAGYGVVGLGIRGFMGRTFSATAAAQLTYGISHRDDEIASSVGFLVSGGVAVRHRRLQILIEAFAAGSKGAVVLGPSLAFGYLL